MKKIEIYKFDMNPNRFIDRMFKRILSKLAPFLRKHGYLKCDYGFACGRHWVEIDGMTMAQGSGNEMNIPDHLVQLIGYKILDKGNFWEIPDPNIGTRVFFINDSI